MPAASATAVQPAQSITGYIDAVAGNQVFGWAWDSRNPTTRLEIEVWIDDKRVATTIADQGRSDLKGNGVGDGHHAFKAMMAEPPKADESSKIRAIARLPGASEGVTLKRRDAGDVSAEN